MIVLDTNMVSELMRAEPDAAGFSVATRNGADFVGCGVAVLDPWRVP